MRGADAGGRLKRQATVGLLLTVVLCSIWAAHAQPVQQPPADDGDGVTLEDSPLAVQPETPAENFEAAAFMVRLDRPKLARLYLQQFIDSQPDDSLLLTLHDKHGQAVFVQLANTQELKPLSTQLLSRVTAALRRRAVDPDRIDQLLTRLDGRPVERREALRSLRTGGAAVVPRILEKMAGDPQRQDVLSDALTRLGRPVVSPLLGALDAPDANLRAAVIGVLGRMQAETVVPWLWYPAFGPQQPAGVQRAARDALARILASSPEEVERVSPYGVAAELKETALAHYRNEHDWPRDEQGRVALWSWQPQLGTVEAARMAPERASLLTATRFARQAVALAPQDREIQALYAGLLLALDRQRVGWEAPLPTGPGTAHDLALAIGPDLVAKALVQAMHNGRADAAQACLRVLSQVESRDQLTKTQAEQAPILAALNYPDSRVQFAAAVAVLELDPDKPFRDSRRVVQILERALNDDGTPAVVVTHANAERARTIGTFAAEMGFDPLVARTGQGAFRLAAGRSDVELILLDVNTIRWALSQTVANLRADARTASIPIVVYGTTQGRSGVQRLLGRHGTMAYIVEPATAEAFRPQVEPFLQTLQTPPLSAQQRSARRGAAAYWLAHIAAGRRSDVFDIAPAQDTLIRTLGDPQLAANALRALSGIPSREAQSMLAESAWNENGQARFREDAAIQLAFHIHRFGLLLDDRETAQIKAAWQSAEDPDLATALASVVGSLKPNTRRVQQRLSRFPVPTPIAPSPASPEATPAPQETPPPMP